MKGRTKVAVVLAALVALPVGVAAIPAGASAAECSVEVLPLPDGVEQGKVITGDASGRYLVGRTVGENEATVLMWHDGTVTEMPEVPTFVEDVNSSGDLVGSDIEDDGYYGHAYRYVDGVQTDLAEPERVDSSTATGIDSNGNAVGYGVIAKTDTYVPLYWPADEPGTVQVLKGGDVGNDKDLAAADISDAGVVVGWGHGWSEGYTGGYVWRDVDSEPEKLVGSDGRHQARPYNVSSDGKWAVGEDSANPDGDLQGVRWNLETGDTTTHPKIMTRVNSSGDAALMRPRPSVVVALDGSETRLSSLDGDRPRFAKVLPDRGAEFTVAGSARDDQGRLRPVVWRGC